MLMDRYIVYGYDFNIYVYDTATKKIVFSGDPGEKLDYGGFFNISEDASKAVFQGWTQDDPEKYYIMLLEPTS